MSPDPIRPVPSQRHGLPPIPLAEQLDNHDEYQAPITDALAGRTLTLHFDDDITAEVTFDTETTLHWSASSELLWGSEGSDEYEAVVLRDDIYAVMISRLSQDTNALVVLDDTTQRVLVNLTTFVTEDGETRERTGFFQAGIDGPLSERYERTEELVGKRVGQRYSSTHVFEHIYLNPNTYVFQGLTGPEAGISDVDAADFWKLGEQLYLFSWHERAQPWNGAVVVDLINNRSTGRMFAWDEISGTSMQSRTTSESTLLSTTTYDAL
ncbi:MAG TPA: MoaF C-terminal domain-containing protein [Baekduia sp.]|nr:MoaF C-terminal domain-containing protein [Baekduia sp.]